MAIKEHTSVYYLDIKFGELAGSSKNTPTRLNIQRNPLEETYIIQDINKLTPSFRLRFQDLAGEYIHLAPFDKSRNKVRFSLNRNMYPETPVVFDFDIYRTFPTLDSIYDVEGLLQCDGLYSPPKIRGFSDTISVAEHLTNIALDELKVDSVDISSSLDRVFMNIVQPDWTTAELLNYLKDNLLGSTGEGCYFCFIKCELDKRIFVFRTLKELYSKNIAYNFTNSSSAFASSSAGVVFYPILDFKVYDNYKALGLKGVKKARYRTFDYDNSTLDEQELKLNNNVSDIDNFLSLTTYFAIDGGDEDTNFSTFSGRTGSVFNPKGHTKKVFYDRLSNLSKFWLTTWGLEDISPGTLVSTEFIDRADLVSMHQYNGTWLVEKVVHLLGNNFGTRLLLTRSGVNTSVNTTLLRADSKNITK